MKVDVPKEWLKASLDDLKVIEHIKNSEDLTHMIAFHSHQAIEKSFKALIEYKQIQIPKQHDLLCLKTLIEDDLEIQDDNLLDTLNALYIDARYPGDLGLLPYGKPTLQDAKKFYEFALKIFKNACKILGTNKNEVDKKL